MTDVEDLPALTRRALETAPAGTHGRRVLQVAAEAFEHDRDPADCWAEETGR